MNDNSQFNKFLNDLGIMTETWILTFKLFIDAGFNTSDALIHTREFMASMMIAAMGNGNPGEKE